MTIPEGREDVLAQARRIVLEDGRLSPTERQGLLRLIASLTEPTQPIPTEETPAAGKEPLPPAGNSASRALLSLLKQQADELDSLKKLSLNLTSSLDLQTVLDAVVLEAMRLVKHAYSADIFLYSAGELTFGASRDLGGMRNRPFMAPRPNGLTATVARVGEAIIVEDMASHPLYRDFNILKNGSIIGIPLTINNNVVG
jgi:hypothetical protein